MPNNITAIVVDDEQDAIDLLCHRLRTLFKNITILASFKEWEHALDALNEKGCDILFLDVSMPGKNAFELLSLLPGLDCEIIFVTAYESYALDAFSHTTSGYLLKPVDDAELSVAVNKAIERASNKKLARQGAHTPQQGLKVGITNNHGTDYVDAAEILFLEGMDKNTRVVTTKGEMVSSQNIGKYQYLAEKPPFYHVHRSYIVNINYILRYESDGIVIMSNKAEIPVSRNVKADFLSLLAGKF